MARIMIVDDDPDILRMLSRRLEREGYEVALFSSCTEALEKISKLRPDLFLIDVNVDSEDGREMCRSVREEPGFDETPILLISANPSVLRTYMMYGADGILEKPFTMESLLDNVRHYIAA